MPGTRPLPSSSVISEALYVSSKAFFISTRPTASTPFTNWATTIPSLSSLLTAPIQPSTPASSDFQSSASITLTTPSEDANSFVGFSASFVPQPANTATRRTAASHAHVFLAVFITLYLTFSNFLVVPSNISR